MTKKEKAAARAAATFIYFIYKIFTLPLVTFIISIVSVTLVSQLLLSDFSWRILFPAKTLLFIIISHFIYQTSKFKPYNDLSQILKTIKRSFTQLRK